MRDELQVHLCTPSTPRRRCPCALLPCRDELQAALAKQLPRDRSTSADALLAEADLDGDGRIDYRWGPGSAAHAMLMSTLPKQSRVVVERNAV